jgi:hypothetical protein
VFVLALSTQGRSEIAAHDHCQIRQARLLDVPHATSPAFKHIKIGQVAESRGYSSKPHDLRATWA